MKTKEVESTLNTIITHIERNPSMVNIQHIENLTRHAIQQVKSVDLADVGERNSDKLWRIMADPSISEQIFNRLCELYDEMCDPVNRGNYPVRIDINYI